jgi:hypothetical protein
MTWWDWETQSIWSQPWGAAIDGELTGARLTLLPYEFDLPPLKRIQLKDQILEVLKGGRNARKRT